ncbi:paraquat-inducible protein A [Crocinitomix algicola]|uniref:paraquat-inducible protein A n=1 Tax=Crocinitomix algicola TaxID=1740263 RepID=UPI000872C6C8|nr:paraquat-inducible protein A [Crocinitomix algicola]
MRNLAGFWISTVFYFCGVVVFSVSITTALSEYKEKKEEVAATMNFEKRLFNAWEWVPGNSVGEEKVKEWGRLEMEARTFYRKAINFSLLLGILVAMYVIFNNLMYRKKESNYQVFGLVMIFCSISFLYLAIQSPFLEVMAYSKDLKFQIPIDVNFDEMDFIGGLGLGEFKYDYEQVIEGRTYYLYQNKSVLELIRLLYTGGNFLVAIIVVVVTILFPVYKFILSLLVLLRPYKKNSFKIYRSIKNLGKWSMLDVFTTAIILAHFAYTNMNEGVDTGSETLVGLYYFLVFVALSINSSQYLKKAMLKAQPESNYLL